jgi:hypothetical protein
MIGSGTKAIARPAKAAVIVSRLSDQSRDR